MPVNPQIGLPKEQRIYCENCKVLLADGYLTKTDGTKVFLCEPCSNNDGKLWIANTPKNNSPKIG
jgi:hypothetical protein